MSVPQAERRREYCLRVFCLALIVVQNSSLILVTSYSRTLRPAYLPSVAVFLGEVLKLIACEALLALELGSTRAAIRRTGELLTDHGVETLKFGIPALCYTLQNNLWYYALSNLDPITAAVTSPGTPRRPRSSSGVEASSSAATPNTVMLNSCAVVPIRIAGFRYSSAMHME